MRGILSVHEIPSLQSLVGSGLWRLCRNTSSSRRRACLLKFHISNLFQKPVSLWKQTRLGATWILHRKIVFISRLLYSILIYFAKCMQKFKKYVWLPFIISKRKLLILTKHTLCSGKLLKGKVPQVPWLSGYTYLHSK